MVLDALADHRRSSEPEVLDALRARDPLALAEAYYRTVGAAQAIGRRFLGPGRETEALLRAVYRRLWETPPGAGALEGWVRAQAFALAAEYLRALGRPAATASAAALLPDLGDPEPGPPDAVEEALGGLDEAARSAVLRAHDRGQAPDEGDAEAAAALDRGLAALAGPVPAPEQADPAAGPHLGAWTLGLLAPDAAARVGAAVVADGALSARAATLRRGRRRLEGLPPGSDVGQRVLVAILAPLPPAAPAPDPAPPAPAAVPLTAVADAGDAPAAAAARAAGAAPTGAGPVGGPSRVAEPEVAGVRGGRSAAAPGVTGTGVSADPDPDPDPGPGGAPDAAAAPPPGGRRGRRRARGLGPGAGLLVTLAAVLGIAAIVLSTPA